ncbi:galactosyl transferase GMA12/MNN10 family-domain-containing protein [Lipomyces chichibuensis]|uniref:galactosyl transferase GMA12/MNN10 family-domain-containing protein n=1 Tax=Lipomyces chichibuensis TaxID=1546026 RepID=UPI003343FA84
MTIIYISLASYGRGAMQTQDVREQQGSASKSPKFVIDFSGQVSSLTTDGADQVDGQTNDLSTAQPSAQLVQPLHLTLDEMRNMAGDSLEPKGKKIVLLTATDGKGNNGAIQNLIEMVTENREEYCAYHDYAYQFINISKFHMEGRPPVWAKIPAIQEAFENNIGAEWVWLLDTDSIIMTPQIDLAKHLLDPKAMETRITYGAPITLTDGKPSGLTVSPGVDVNNVDIIIAQDEIGVNAGSILFRRSDWTMSLLQEWIDPHNVQQHANEQDALNHMIVNNKEIRQHVAIVSQRVINAFSVGGEHMGWKTGDLVVHFAGCWVENACDSRWKDFWSRRKTVSEAIADFTVQGFRASG